LLERAVLEIDQDSESDNTEAKQDYAAILAGEGRECWKNLVKAKEERAAD